jgi:DNA polymerase (family 10)
MRPDHAPTNAEIARALRELGLFLDIEGVPFKPAAYEKAAHAVAGAPQALTDLYAHGGEDALHGVPGVGKGIAGKIGELLRTGHIEELERLRKARPVDVLALTAVEGVGPRTVRLLHEALGIRTLDELAAAAREGRLRDLPHFGERSEQRLLHHLDILLADRGRRPIAAVRELARRLEEGLRACPAVAEVRVAGSFRRFRETVGDLDLVAASARPREVMDAFVDLPEVEDVYSRGDTRTLVRLRAGLDADLRVVPPDAFGAALLYFTGSKAHGVALRRIARQKGLKLNEYGLFRDERRIAAATEDEIYGALGLAPIPPELREDAGEIEAAREGRLPDLIRAGALRGDLQVQTDWTDGSASIAEMVEAARALGYEYIAITDHTRDLPMVRGSDEARLREQMSAIRLLNTKLHGFKVLSGAEVNIRRDGTLDVDDATLAELDVVGVGIHHHFGLPKDEMTRRVVRAMENPHVDILFHPTARRLGHRAPVALDMEAVVAAAARTGTALEIDAQPERLDLRDELVRLALRAGVRLVIDSDAHRPDDLRYADEFGIPVARRGWATRADILNTLPIGRMLASLKDGRRR